MCTVSTFALTLAALTVSAAFTASAAQPRTGRPAVERTDGRALFLTHCASCHGTTARGDGPVAPSLRESPGDLTQFARRNGGVFPSSKVHRIIEGRDVRAHGSVEMPVWGDAFRRLPGDSSTAAAAERIEAIVHYLASIQERTGHEESGGHHATLSPYPLRR